MQRFGTITLEKHPQIMQDVLGHAEQDSDGWTRTTLRSDGASADKALATVRQQADARTQVQFRHEKGGFFGIVHTPDTIYIALPGSRIHLPDTELEMPGELIPGNASAPMIPPPAGQVQQVTDQAMILGAGLASRFVPISGDLTGYSKPAVPLVGEDSVIVTLSRHLQRHGIRKILVNTYYKPEALKRQLENIDDIEFIFIDETHPSGTAGGLAKGLQQGLVDRTKPILIMQGDAVTNANISSQLKTHAAVQPLVTLGVRHVTDDLVPHMAIVVTDRSDADGESGRLQFFQEKPTLSEAGDHRLGSIGFYVISERVYDSFLNAAEHRWTESPEFDYAMDFFPGLLQTEGVGSTSPIYAHKLEEPFYWCDIGRPDQYLATLRDIYAGRLGLPLPADATQFCEEGVLYWPSAKAGAVKDQASVFGNVLVVARSAQ